VVIEKENIDSCAFVVVHVELAWPEARHGNNHGWIIICLRESKRSTESNFHTTATRFKELQTLMTQY